MPLSTPLSRKIMLWGQFVGFGVLLTLAVVAIMVASSTQSGSSQGAAACDTQHANFQDSYNFREATKKIASAISSAKLEEARDFAKVAALTKPGSKVQADIESLAEAFNVEAATIQAQNDLIVLPTPPTC